jgi:hypothetical protein
MFSDVQMRWIAGFLAVASVALLPIIIVGAGSSFMYFAFPMQAGVILAVAYLFRQYRKNLCKWDQAVPSLLYVVVPLMVFCGVIAIAYGFSNAMPSRTPSGEFVSSYSANFENGVCQVVYIKVQSFVMPAHICTDFVRKLGTAFCGFWLIGSAIINWFSWKRRKIT